MKQKVISLKKQSKIIDEWKARKGLLNSKLY